MRFYLGTHEASWLGRVSFPLFVSHRRLKGRRTLRAATCPWALDSGGFSELTMFGRWTTSEGEYAGAVERYASMGRLEWAAPQDWMCEPWLLAKTGLSVERHQRLTVGSVLGLRSRGLPVNVVPVLQGWSIADYHRCAELYGQAGVDLAAEPVVGVGSVCRRQSTDEIRAIFESLAGLGLRLHGFGVKTKGLAKYGGHLASADSMAWSSNARRNPPMDGCSHKSCANCLLWAGRWRDQVLAGVQTVTQLGMAVAA